MGEIEVLLKEQPNPEDSDVTAKQEPVFTEAETPVATDQTANQLQSINSTEAADMTPRKSRTKEEASQEGPTVSEDTSGRLLKTGLTGF